MIALSQADMIRPTYWWGAVALVVLVGAALWLLWAVAYSNGYDDGRRDARRRQMQAADRAEVVRPRPMQLPPVEVFE